MAKTLRAGLIDPHDIEQKELPLYMADTYRGYMVSIKERMQLITNVVNVDFGYAEFNREFLALQIRMIFELMAFAVLTANQQERPIARSKRTKTGAIEVIKLAGEGNWFESVDPKYLMTQYSGEIDVPMINTNLSDPVEFKATHGRLGVLLHEQQRPRPTEQGRLSRDDLLSIRNQVHMTLSKHIIRNTNGHGWYVDLHAEGEPRDILVVKLEICDSA